MAQARLGAKRWCWRCRGLRPIHDLELERLLTAIRRGLLQCAAESGDLGADADAIEFYCALAQQCFINEYVFAQSDAERGHLRAVQDRVTAALDTDAEIAPRDLVERVSYLPLHTLPNAATLLAARFPGRAHAIARPADHRAARGSGGP